MKLDALEVLAKAADVDMSIDLELFSQWVTFASPQAILKMIVLIRALAQIAEKHGYKLTPDLKEREF